MSWSLNAVGRPAAVLAKLKQDVATNKCREPEETIRAQAMAAIETALGAYPDSYAVEVRAAGSQYSPDASKQEFVNSLSVEIKPLFGFVE